MDIEKPLQQTSHSMPLLEGSFYMNNLPTRLILYPDSFYFCNDRLQSTYVINFDFIYDIVQQNNGSILYIACPQTIQFFSPQDLSDWETVLIKIMKRKKFHEFFKGIKKIGKGNFASVYLTQRLRDKANFAVKAFQKQSTYKQTNGKEGLQNEIKVLRQLNHKNIANLEGVYETDNSIYLVMQLIQGKCLADILQEKKSLPLQRRKKLIKGILLALLEMERKQIVHRDLKPQNIMIDQNDQPKLVDFGLATETNAPSYLYVRCGTPGYVAPQIITIKDTDHARMHTISDVFSAGAIFYHMIFGRALFDGDKNSEVLDKNRKCFFNVPVTSQLSQFQQLSLLRSMLDINPDTRTSAFQALRMDYFGDGTHPLVQFGDRDNYGRQLPPLKSHNQNFVANGKLHQVKKVQRPSMKEN